MPINSMPAASRALRTSRRVDDRLGGTPSAASNRLIVLSAAIQLRMARAAVGLGVRELANDLGALHVLERPVAIADDPGQRVHGPRRRRSRIRSGPCPADSHGYAYLESYDCVTAIVPSTSQVVRGVQVALRGYCQARCTSPIIDSE